MQLCIHGSSDQITRVVMMYYCRREVFVRILIRGSYDISSAGHVDAGDETLESALRELREELGIEAAKDEFDRGWNS